MAVSWDGHFSNLNLETFFALREAAVGPIDLDELLAAAPPPPSEDARERFWYWVDVHVPEFAISDLEIMLHHLDTFWQVRDQPNIMLLRYEDLIDDLEGQMRYIADRLGIAIAETVWPGLVQAATFEGMKGRASELAAEASHDGFYNDRDQFFRKGSSGTSRVQVTCEPHGPQVGILPRIATRAQARTRQQGGTDR